MSDMGYPHEVEPQFLIGPGRCEGANTGVHVGGDGGPGEVGGSQRYCVTRIR